MLVNIAIVLGIIGSALIVFYEIRNLMNHIVYNHKRHKKQSKKYE